MSWKGFGMVFVKIAKGSIAVAKWTDHPAVLNAIATIAPLIPGGAVVGAVATEIENIQK